MSVFSKGVASYPDSVITLLLICLMFLSCSLNPLVLHHSLSRAPSVASTLFSALALADFLTVLVYSGNGLIVVGKAGFPRCYWRNGTEESEIFFCDGKLPRGSTHGLSPGDSELEAGDIMLSVLLRLCVGVTSSLTACLVVCRFLSLRFPFQHVQRRWCAAAVGLPVLYMGCTFSVFYSHRTAVYDYATLSVINIDYFPQLKPSLIFLVSGWPVYLLQVTSILLSLATALHLALRSPPLRKTPQCGGLRSSVKILLQNAGSLVMTACMSFVFYSLETGACRFVETWQMGLFAIFVAVPPLLSCVNPIVFILLTPKLAGWDLLISASSPSRDRIARCPHRANHLVCLKTPDTPLSTLRRSHRLTTDSPQPLRRSKHLSDNRINYGPG